MKRQTHTTHQEQEQTAAHQQSAQHQTAVEFATAEEMIRHDAALTPVPPVVAGRLHKSITREPKPVAAHRWWQRWFVR